jgi:hypothetical protein
MVIPLIVDLSADQMLPYYSNKKSDLSVRFPQDFLQLHKQDRKALHPTLVPVKTPALRLDLVEQKLWRGHEQIVLTRKSFELLRYLVEHRGTPRLPRSDRASGKSAGFAGYTAG